MAVFEQEGQYLNEVIITDFMKFAFETRNEIGESKRPLEMPIDPSKKGEEGNGN